MTADVLALGEWTERTLLRAVRPNPIHEQVRCLNVGHPPGLEAEHLGNKAGTAVVVTSGVAVGNQLGGITGVPWADRAARYRSS
jgi:hypothetical protein